jgi:hypothetical protein
MIETTATVNTGWHTVNFGFNDGVFYAGYLDSAFDKDFAKREKMNYRIGPNQKIIGVFGYTKKSDGTLRSIGLIIANGSYKL